MILRMMTLLLGLSLSGCLKSKSADMELHYKQASIVKDGGSIVVDFTDKNNVPVSYLFRKDNRVFLADHDKGRIAAGALVHSKLELAALEREIAAHIEKFSGTEHKDGRARRSEMFRVAETLMRQGNTDEAARLYDQVRRDEEEVGDGDYGWAKRALEILRASRSL